MTSKLLIQAITKYFLGVILVGALIFIPAGDIKFTQGWILMVILFIPMFVAGLVMMKKNPELLRKRLVAKEKQKDQDIVVKLRGLMFLVGFIVAGLGVRLGWYVLPMGVSVCAAAFFVDDRAVGAGNILYFGNFHYLTGQLGKTSSA